MARPRSATSSSKLPARLWRGANLGFEARLWAAGGALRNSMDAAECKRVALGLQVKDRERLIVETP